VSGRIGRVRYIAYSIALSVLVLIGTGILAVAVAVVDETAAIGVLLIGYLATYAIQFLPGIQRSHDINVSGWLSLITLVPFGPLVFWFVPGTRGENNYGLQPPPNGVGVILIASFLPVISVVGILAAIAIPAYQDYTIRAQVSEGLNMAAAPKAAIVEAFDRTGAAPADRPGAGLSDDPADTAGRYVASIDVERGTLVVTYGSNANSTLAGRVLAIQPYVVDGGVVWRCGHAPEPSGAAAMDAAAPSSAAVTDIEARHLPSACRP
jgi:type IV pilus assembly protein PilA